MTPSDAPHPATRTYEEFTALASWRRRWRTRVRDLAVATLSVGRSIRGDGWIRFPYYHHVFDDERAGFRRQLEQLRGYGEFISMDDAVAMIARETPIKGRYFCITFDDGLKSCIDNALPILSACRAPATFFVVSDLVGQSLPADHPIARQVFDFLGRDTALEFLTWDDCRELVRQGMGIGSHTRTHPRLSALDEDQAAEELSSSKVRIEQEVGCKCLHFCPPYGIPGVHFDAAREARLARRIGYRSLVTGLRGATCVGADPFTLRRDQLLAGWSDAQLRYFFSAA